MLSGLFTGKSDTVSMKWNPLENITQVEEINALSNDKPVLIFKHSTRCSISSMALSRFERSYSNDAGLAPYFLDLIAFREVSNFIAEHYGVEHQSPQVIVIQKGKATYHNSHNGIDFEDVVNQIKG